MTRAAASVPAAEAQLDILVLTPTGADGTIAQRVLGKSGFNVRVCPDMRSVCASIDDRAGTLLLAEEALDDASREMLFDALDAQPSWSDIPVIVITGEDELSRALPLQVTTLTDRVNLTLLERPVRVATLLTVLTAALRARRRQMDVRHAVEMARLAQEEAEDANRAKATFLTTMSHELRTPLNAIAGYTEILALEIPGPLNDAQRGHLDSIARSERHLLGLINDVLNFAKIEAGHVGFNMAPVDVSAVVRGLETFIAPQLTARDLQYQANAPDGLTAFADEEKMRQILLNLLSNAIKFTPPGGKITVDAARTDGSVTITVGDTGEGIAEDQLRSIFEPFVQVGRVFSSPAEGTGLGLSISRDLARRMGGDLVASSEPGTGATFSLTLPREPAADEPES